MDKQRAPVVELLPSLPNLPPSNTFKGKALFLLRRIADLQVSSVFQHLRPWLAAISGSVLEIGCGAQPYRHLVPTSCIYHGLDWHGAKEHFDYSVPDTTYYDGTKFPFENASFDYVFHTEVLEHIYDTDLFLRECKRVLRSDGKMFFSVPFQARYHYIPYDYWRFTPASLQQKLSALGFTKITIEPRGTDITVAAYKIVSLFYRWLMSDILGIIIALVFSPVAVSALFIGHASRLTMAGSTDDCLGYVVKASG